MKNLNNIVIAKQVLADIDNIPKDVFSDEERQRFAKILEGSITPVPTKIVIEQDGCFGNSPRDWDNANTFVSFDRRIRGDEDAESDLIEAIENSRDYKQSWGDEWGNLDCPTPAYLAELLNQCTDIKWQYVYLYDHGGYSLSTSGGTCAWDTSRIGIIFITHKKACQEWGWKRLSPKRKQFLEKIQDEEIKTLSQYVSGEVYGFILYDQFGNELDSGWGFYGYDIEENGMAENLPDNWKDLELVRK